MVWGIGGDCCCDPSLIASGFAIDQAAIMERGVNGGCPPTPSQAESDQRELILNQSGCRDCGGGGKERAKLKLQQHEGGTG